MTDYSSKLSPVQRLELPWLKTYDLEMEKVGVSGVHAEPRLEPGTRAYVDVANQKAVAIEPSGRVRSWNKNGRLHYDPDERSWEMEWLETGSDDNPRVWFTPMDEDCEDEVVLETGYQFESSNLEGKQDTYFPLMVELLRDPLFNPAGFPLPSGIYKADMNQVRFELNFGENGAAPSMRPDPESLPAPLDFPYRTEINVTRPIADAKGEDVAPGYYRTRVTGFNTITGEVRTLEVRGERTKFRLGGDAIVRHIHSGDIELLNVLQEHRPSF